MAKAKVETDDGDLKSSLAALAAQVNKSYKGESPVQVGGGGFSGHIKGYIPTGCFPLDTLMHGGAPMGRIIEIYGPSHAGKSTLAAHLMANCQKMGGIVILLDSERTWDKERAEDLGVKTDEVVHLVVYDLDSAFRKAYDLINQVSTNPKFSNRPVLFVFDTLAGLPTAAANNDEGDRYKGGIGDSPRIIKSGLIRIKDLISKCGAAFVIINQITAVIGGGRGPTFDSPGGNAMKHLTTMKLRLTASKLPPDGGNNTFGDRQGINCRAKVEKDKLSGRFQVQQVIFPMYCKGGINSDESVLTYLTEVGDPYVTHPHGWYSIDFNGTPIKLRLAEITQVCNEVEGLRDFLHSRVVAQMKIVSSLPDLEPGTESN